MVNTSFIQIVQLNLVGIYDITKAGSFQIGQNFGFNIMDKVRGLRIADETELNAAMGTDPAAIICPYSVLNKLTISLANANTNGLVVENLPLTALQIAGTTEIKAGPFYKLDFPIDWENSFINVCAGIALPTPNFYTLAIQVFF
jgi:hypothetical protein